MIGSAWWMAWNVALRLIAMMASHFSGGKSSIGATYWMPALFTRMSTLPNAALVLATRSAISAGLVMSAPLYSTFTPHFLAISGALRLDRSLVAEAVQHDVAALRPRTPRQWLSRCRSSNR